VLVRLGRKLRKGVKQQFNERRLRVCSFLQMTYYASKIAQSYNLRDQIEESFRDQKSRLLAFECKTSSQFTTMITGCLPAVALSRNHQLIEREL